MTNDILKILDALGLLQYNRKNNYIIIEEIFEGFLHSKHKNLDFFKTKLIIENDFKLYAYS